MEILKVENVCKIYGKGETKVTALDGVSFSIEKGEFVSIVGQSGSGKSTLLHIIGGVDKPTSGRIIVDGKEVLQKSQEELAIYRRRQVGLIYQLGDMYMEEVTADDIRLALVPMSKKSEGMYNTVNMLIKCIFYSAERNQLIEYNPCAGLNAKGGKPGKRKEALTDQQAKVLVDTVKGLPPYLFVMIGLYAGLRREEILGLQWDSVFLDTPTPYISVQRAWRAEHNRPVISTVLKTKAAKRDIPIPKCLVECLREAKVSTISDYVIADSQGEPLSYSQFMRVWQYIVVRSTKERTYYKYVNGQSIKYSVKPTLGMKQKNNPDIQYTIDFDVTPHQLRHTYITNLLYAGVDPKTVQYLAGHENSKTTMDIYAKVKYNKPEELFDVVNGAFQSENF